MLRWFNRIATVTADAVTARALATLALGLVGGRFGYRAVFMTTGSMRPAIVPGDLVIVRPVDPDSIGVGDVITFEAPLGKHELVTHRVVAMTTSAQGPEFKTRGDANQVADIWTVRYQGLGWTEVTRVRGVGAVTAFLDTLPGRVVVVSLVFLLALGLLLPTDGSERRTPAAAGAAA